MDNELVPVDELVATLAKLDRQYGRLPELDKALADLAQTFDAVASAE